MAHRGSSWLIVAHRGVAAADAATIRHKEKKAAAEAWLASSPSSSSPATGLPFRATIPAGNQAGYTFYVTTPQVKDNADASLEFVRRAAAEAEAKYKP